MEFFHNQGELFKLPPIRITNLAVDPFKINVMNNFITVLCHDDKEHVYLVNRKDYKFIYKKKLGSNLSFLQSFDLFPDSTGSALNLALSISEDGDNKINLKILSILYPQYTIKVGRNQNGSKCMNYLKDC